MLAHDEAARDLRNAGQMGADDKKLDGNIEPPPAALAPGVPEKTSLPAIAAKADDLEEIKKAVEDAASVSGGLWLSYLFVLSYVAIAAGAVTHKDLLLENPVKLPFLNVELPLLAFFALAPFVVLITHIYALMHFRMLGNKARHFHKVLRDAFPGQGDNKVIRGNKRRLLPSNIFVQILAGPPEVRGGFFGFMLIVIALVTLVLLPVLVLLLLQIQFLPFHDTRITWAQRGALFLDVLLLWPLRPPILADLSAEISFRPRRALREPGHAIALVLSVEVIWFSFVYATVQEEWRQFPLVYMAAIEGIVTGSWLSTTLRLEGFDIFETLKIDDPKKLDWKNYIFDLHSRQLEGAVFDRATLGKVNLTGAHLEGASLRKAQLQGASLLEAELQGVNLIQAQLQGATLAKAQLQGATLLGAQLQGATLLAAQLQGASLDYAQLQGAALDFAKLQGASLKGAQLQGVSLLGAHLQGASLSRTHLQGATLVGVEVNATSFSNALLWRADWGDSVKRGAVQLEDGAWTLPWDINAYEGLRVWMNDIPEGKMRDAALKRIERLDCGNPDKTLASCDQSLMPPFKIFDWQMKLAAASVDGDTFAKALAEELRSLVCESGGDAIHILRGVISNGQLAKTGRGAPTLVDTIIGKKEDKPCPVSAALTEDDKASLLQIKREAEINFPPPAASKKDK